MHKEILSEEQVKLLPLVNAFSSKFGLVGGTAVALQIGHRRSLDFDLFTKSEFTNHNILKRISNGFKPDTIIVNKLDELTLTVNRVKLTFFRYPYDIRYSKSLRGIIKMPDLVTLAAMKACLRALRRISTLMGTMT